MPMAKSKKAVGLGNSLMNDRFGKNKKSEMHRGNAEAGIRRTNMDGETYITNQSKEASWVKMRSVTEQAALDDFLSTAELAGTDFTAEKTNNVKIIHKDQKNPYLLSVDEEKTMVKKHKENRDRLTVPRRPQWDKTTTPQQLDVLERDSILQWRRGLAELQEMNDLLMTPFERNLEVWRQLWRVIERSDLVVQIVDARNPLLFRSEDLEVYVKEVDSKKNNLLLVNKADMMTLEQRQTWADYFHSAGINFKFFSAELAKELNEARKLAEEEAAEAAEYSDSDSEEESEDEEEAPAEPEAEPVPLTEAEERIRILSTEDLEALFLANAPEIDTGPGAVVRKTQIGLVGYPNVGKSSTINALIGSKKVSVSATPGKTKHFQTIHLSDEVILCDCPGLVFPNFATTKAELVCSGVLPIDQLREYTGPSTLVAQRIPQYFLEAIYGMKVQVRSLEEGGTGNATGEEILRAYASARGFSTQGFGQPDESRAARHILKDYVKGKLLYCHPPPAAPPIDAKKFNRELYDANHLPERRRRNLVVVPDSVDMEDGDSHSDVSDSEDEFDIEFAPQGAKTHTMDKRFFAPGQGTPRITLPFHEKYSEQGKLKPLSGRKLKSMVALERNVDPAEIKMGSKRHYKANKKRAKKEKTEYV